MNYFVYPGIIQADFYKFCNKTYTGNGRMYDPALGRFLSPDPFMQDPSNTQNFNRYSYCLNNPLKFTDPSGFTFIGASEKNQTQISYIEGINKRLQYDWYYWFQSLDKVRDRITWGKSYHGGEGTALTHYLLCYDYISIISIDGSSYEKRYYNQDVISTQLTNSIGSTHIINSISHLENNDYSENNILVCNLPTIEVVWDGETPNSARIIGLYDDLPRGDTKIEWYRTTSMVNYIAGTTAELMSDLSKSKTVIKITKITGKVTIIIGVVTDALGVITYYQSGPNDPNAVSPTKATINTGVAIYGIWNPAVAITYGLIETFYPGGSEGYLKDLHNAYNPKNDPYIEQSFIQHSMAMPF